MLGDQKIFLITQKDPDTEVPGLLDVYKIGTIAVIKQVVRMPKDVLRILVEAERRAELLNFEEEESEYLRAEVALFTGSDEMQFSDIEQEAMLRNLKELFAVYCEQTQKILWLTIVCAAISVYGTMRAFTAQQSNLEMLSLRSQLITDSYHAIETKMKESAALRHEMKHHLTALDALCQKNDMDGLKELLQNMLEKDERQAQIHFTKNYTVNAILQNAALRAAQSDIRFDARAELPQDFPCRSRICASSS